jgi:tRNA pseudouridine55 synthase
MDGVVNLNKSDGISSRRAVDQVRRLFGIKKAGHGGTLDPTATGVLLICLGRGTKLFDALQIGTKAYQATMILGMTTDSFDTSGQVLTKSPTNHLSVDQIEQTLKRFTGQILQTVPMFSAVKRNGQPLYKMARKGIQLDELPIRKVEITRLELNSVELLASNGGVTATIDVSCSKGTYIRSLVSDIGQELDCGAVLSQLIRTSSGVFHLSDAYTIKQLKQNPSTAYQAVIPLEQVNQMLDRYQEQISTLKIGTKDEQ